MKSVIYATTEEGVVTLGATRGREEFAEAIVFDPADPNRIFLGLRSGRLVCSEDGGESWTRLEPEIPAIADLKVVRSAASRSAPSARELGFIPEGESRINEHSTVSEVASAIQ